MRRTYRPGAAILLSLADDFPFIAAFDNFGFCLCAGTMIEKWNIVLELIAIGARYRINEASLGKPRIYYLDILFVPRHWERSSMSSSARLPEMTPALHANGAANDHAGRGRSGIAQAREYHAKVG